MHCTMWHPILPPHAVLSFFCWAWHGVREWSVIKQKEMFFFVCFEKEREQDKEENGRGRERERERGRGGGKGRKAYLLWWTKHYLYWGAMTESLLHRHSLWSVLIGCFCFDHRRHRSSSRLSLLHPAVRKCCPQDRLQQRLHFSLVCGEGADRQTDMQTDRWRRKQAKSGLSVNLLLSH